MNIAIYCGSHHGDNPNYTSKAVELCTWLAKEGHDLVYGAGRCGLMGVVSDTMLKEGAKVYGVIPHFLATIEEMNEDITELTMVDTMAERKTKMMDMADAYIALPGGPGTLEEIAEIMSMVRLNRFNKPCILYNIDGFYDSLEVFVNSMASHAFMGDEQLHKFDFVTSLEEIQSILQGK